MSKLLNAFGLSLPLQQWIAQSPCHFANKLDNICLNRFFCGKLFFQSELLKIIHFAVIGKSIGKNEFFENYPIW